MADIICPNCNKALKVDEAGYAHILKQVHNQEFEIQLKERLSQAEKDKISALQLAEKDSESAIQTIKAEKDIKIEQLNSQIREKDNSFQSNLNDAMMQ